MTINAHGMQLCSLQIPQYNGFNTGCSDLLSWFCIGKIVFFADFRETCTKTYKNDTSRIARNEKTYTSVVLETGMSRHEYIVTRPDLDYNDNVSERRLER